MGINEKQTTYKHNKPLSLSLSLSFTLCVSLSLSTNLSVLPVVWALEWRIAGVHVRINAKLFSCNEQSGNQ